MKAKYFSLIILFLFAVFISQAFAIPTGEQQTINADVITLKKTSKALVSAVAGIDTALQTKLDKADSQYGNPKNISELHNDSGFGPISYINDSLTLRVYYEDYKNTAADLRNKISAIKTDTAAWNNISNKPDSFTPNETSGFILNKNNDVSYKLTGNVGIGTSAPGEYLTVLKPGATMIRVADSITGGGITLGQDNIIGALVQSHTDSAGKATQNAKAIRQNFGASGFIISSAPAVAVGASRTFTPRFIVTPDSGNVGIGTTTPTEKVEVSGYIKATGFIGLGDSITNLNWNNFSNKPTDIMRKSDSIVITNISSLYNDSAFISKSDSHLYNEWTLKSDSTYNNPVKVSDLKNDSGFLDTANANALYLSKTASDTINGNLKTTGYLYVGDSFVIGTNDAYARGQIWNYKKDSILRLGSTSADGDPTNRTSEGIVVYGQAFSGNPLTNVNFGYARIKHNRFGLYNGDTGVADYYFRVDPASLFLKNTSLTKTFEIIVSSGNAVCSGSITANKFIGNGSLLTNLPAAGFTDTNIIYTNSIAIDSHFYADSFFGSVRVDSWVIPADTLILILPFFTPDTGVYKNLKILENGFIVIVEYNNKYHIASLTNNIAIGEIILIFRKR